MHLIEAAQWLWRLLPREFRVTMGRPLRSITEPLLALRIPPAGEFSQRHFTSVTILGLFSSPIGHGVAAQLLEAELKSQGICVRRIDASAWVGAPIDPNLVIRSDKLQPEDALIVALNPDAAVLALLNLGSAALRNRKIIGYWVWELEKAPRYWKLAGRFAHEIWTPSAFSAEALKGLFDIPIHIVPHPVALVPPPELSSTRRARGRASLGVSEDAFVAFQSFSLSSSLTRKNAIGAISAFVAAFKGKPDARLVLRYLAGDRFPDSLHRLQEAARIAGPQVIVRAGCGGLDELHDLYAACDVYVSLHRTEGFGLNLAEVMLAGRPLIATKWSGNLDFMTSTSVALINADLVPLEDLDRVYVQRGARWAEPRIEEAIHWLRMFAEDPSLRITFANAAKESAKGALSGSALQALNANSAEPHLAT
jgi:glycosyltransferase involved in cell wall biosynthesis